MNKLLFSTKLSNLYLLLLVILILLFINCVSNDQQESTKGEVNVNLQKTNEITQSDGQREIYKLWKYEKELASLPKKELEPELKTRLIRELRGKTFIQYNETQSRSFRNYRAKILELSKLEGSLYGYTYGEMKMAKNAVIGDWALDYLAAQDINSQFAEDIKKHLKFMESMALMGYRDDISGTALIYAKLYVLANKLMNASVENERSHLIRAALLSIDPSSANNMRDMNSLSQLKKELCTLSMFFGSNNWYKVRTIGVISPLLRVYNECNLRESDFTNSRSYNRVADGARAMDEIIRDHNRQRGIR